MTNFVLIRVSAPSAARAAIPELRTMWLESKDGERIVRLNGPIRSRRVSLLNGFTGLGVAPVVLDRRGIPGAPGGVVSAVSTVARPVVLPIMVLGADQAEAWALVQEIRDLTDPGQEVDVPRSFYLMCSSPSGVRRLELTYESGLEGTEYGQQVYDRLVLQCIAPQPFAEDRDETTLEFRLGEEFEAFLGTSGTDLPWGTRTLSPTTVIGDGMQVEMTSAVPFYATVEIEGPSGPVLIEADTGLRIDVPLGVDEGDLFRIVTDPRSPSARYNGSLAAGRIALGSRRAPLLPGLNVIDVTAPDADENTRLRLSWRGRHRSLW